MASAITIRAELQGEDATHAKLRAVDEKVRLKAVRDAVAGGSKVVAEVARAAAPHSDPVREPTLQSGLLAMSVGSRVKVYRQADIAVGIVGPRAGFRRARGRYRFKEKRVWSFTGTGWAVRSVLRATSYSRKQVKTITHARAGLLGRLGATREKTLYQTPTNYGHLAGPGRRQQFMDQAAAALPQAEEAMEAKLRAAVQEL
jgi:hypothetical protein